MEIYKGSRDYIFIREGLEDILQNYVTTLQAFPTSKMSSRL